MEAPPLQRCRRFVKSQGAGVIFWPWQVGAMAVLGTAKQFQMFSLGLGMDATAPTSEDFRSSMLWFIIAFNCAYDIIG